MRIVEVITLTAGADTEVAASGKLQENQADPQIALDSGGDSALRYCGIYSGGALLSAFTLLSGMTALDGEEFGAASCRAARPLRAPARSRSATPGRTTTWRWWPWPSRRSPPLRHRRPAAGRRMMMGIGI